MVLESLINPANAEKTPRMLLLYGAIYTIAGIILALAVFKAYATLIFVFLAAMAAIPLIYNMIKYEEEKDLTDMGETLLLKEHGKALRAFMLLFIGMTLASVAAYTLLPSETVGSLFDSQTKTITTINGRATGGFGHDVGIFSKIFLNNVGVMIYCIVFSLLYGAGAIFILSWNASVIGVAIGNFIRGNFASYAHLVGFDKVAQYFQIVSIGLLKYIIHGVPEILAYFTAGLAGGIISIAIIKHDMKTRKFEHILLDSADLILVSIALLFIAGVLEVWVTPLIF